MPPARDYAEALKRDPESLRLRTGYAALLAEAGDNAAAARALDAGKQTDVVYGARAAYAARADDKSLLGKLYRDMQSDTATRSGKRLYLLGQVAELIGKDKQAADWYRQVPEDDERWFDAGIRMVVLIDKQGDSEAALRKINELRLAVGTDTRETVDLYLLEADLLSRKSKKREAIAVYTRGLDQLHDEPRLLYARAMLHIDLDDIAAGERDLRALLATDPDSADALNALGYTLADRTDRYAEANALIEKAIKIKPDEPAIIDSYGWAQYRLGNLDEAVAPVAQGFRKAARQRSGRASRRSALGPWRSRRGAPDLGAGPQEGCRKQGADRNDEAAGVVKRRQGLPALAGRCADRRMLLASCAAPRLSPDGTLLAAQAQRERELSAHVAMVAGRPPGDLRSAGWRQRLAGLDPERQPISVCT